MSPEIWFFYALPKTSSGLGSVAANQESDLETKMSCKTCFKNYQHVVLHAIDLNRL